MRGSPQTMRFLRPHTVGEALRLCRREPEAIPLAGGTDFMVAWNTGELNHRTVLDLSALDAWRRIRPLRDGWSIGALVTHRQLQDHADLRRAFPLLAAAARTVGGLQIQNRGTLGGNIANASPAGDSFPPLAIYEARVHTVSPRGRRSYAFDEIFTGVKTTCLAQGELITSVAIPLVRPRPTRKVFRKVGTRAAQAISKTVAAGLLWLRKDGTVRELRFALGSMAATVRRLSAAENYVAGRKLTRGVIDHACQLLDADVSPIDDLRSTREYRLHVSRNILRAFLQG